MGLAGFNAIASDACCYLPVIAAASCSFLSSQSQSSKQRLWHRHEWREVNCQWAHGGKRKEKQSRFVLSFPNAQCTGPTTWKYFKLIQENLRNLIIFFRYPYFSLSNKRLKHILCIRKCSGWLEVPVTLAINCQPLQPKLMIFLSG